MAERGNSGFVPHIARLVGYALFLTLIAMVAGTLHTQSSVHAAPQTGNYQLNLQVTNGPFSYGGSTLPQFQATLTALNGTTLSSCTGSTYVTISIDTEPGTNWGSTSQYSPGANICVYTYVNDPPDWNHYTTGLRTATAQATVSSQVVATSTVTFMVNKIVTSTSCFSYTGAPVYQSGSTLQIGQQVTGPSSNYTPDWTQSKFDVTLTGPASVTYANITPNLTPNAGLLTVTAPTTPGNYNLTCTFDGYGDYAPSTSGKVGIIISAFHQVGGITLYTNPTTYNPYQSCDVYVVFQAAPGGPAPTGYASFRIGSNYTPNIKIGANGILAVRLNPLPLPGQVSNQITVYYDGDAYYRWTSANFTFTNPAIPSNAPTSGSGGSIGSSGKAGSPQATTTTTIATTTTTAPATASGATPASTGANNGNAGSSRSDPSGGSPLLWIGLGVVALGLGGGGLALVVRARIAKAKLGVPLQSPHRAGWPQSPDEHGSLPPEGW